jgi:hypothetical protein
MLECGVYQPCLGFNYFLASRLEVWAIAPIAHAILARVAVMPGTVVATLTLFKELLCGRIIRTRSLALHAATAMRDAPGRYIKLANAKLHKRIIKTGKVNVTFPTSLV